MSSETFGTRVRADRMGFRWSRNHNCYVRISDDTPETWLIEACPPEALPNRVSDREYRRWWDDADGGSSLLLMVMPLWALVGRGTDKPIKWIVGEDGKIDGDGEEVK